MSSKTWRYHSSASYYCSLAASEEVIQKNSRIQWEWVMTTYCILVTASCYLITSVMIPLCIGLKGTSYECIMSHENRVLQ